MRVLVGFLIGFFVLMLVGIFVIVWLYWYTDKKRAEALKKIMNICKERGIPMSPIYVLRNLERLNLLDLKNIDDWLTAVDKKDIASAAALWPKASNALKKTDLGLVFGVFGSILNAAV